MKTSFGGATLRAVKNSTEPFAHPLSLRHARAVMLASTRAAVDHEAVRTVTAARAQNRYVGSSEMSRTVPVTTVVSAVFAAVDIPVAGGRRRRPCRQMGTLCGDEIVVSDRGDNKIAVEADVGGE